MDETKVEETTVAPEELAATPETAPEVAPDTLSVGAADEAPTADKFGQ